MFFRLSPTRTHRRPGDRVRFSRAPAGKEGNEIAWAASTEPLVAPKPNYLNADHGVKSWLLTTDHKRIALLYLVTITLMFFVGGTFAA